jgi:uncharacterized cupin superfamily protein
MGEHSGVFKSTVATDDWTPDPEVGGEMHVLVKDEGGFAGMSRFRHTSVVGPWTLPVRETIVVLEGAARIEIEGGPALDLRVGDMASLPEGAVTTWHLTLPYKEIWFFGRPYDATDGGAPIDQV